jgi:hypothetical protein
VSVHGRAAWILARGRVKLDYLRIAQRYALQQNARIERRNCGDERKDRVSGACQCAKHAMRLLGRLFQRRILVDRRVISGAVADDEYVARRAGLRRREMTDDHGAQDEMNREGKTCRGGNPWPPASSISAQLQHSTHLASTPLALRRAELKAAPSYCRRIDAGM